MQINERVCDSCWKHGIRARSVVTIKFYDPDVPVTRGAPKAEKTLDLCDPCQGDVLWLLNRPATERVRQAP